ncbi:MAG: radical SAM protein [Planctomycetes bacterium]|nr:radical SAM protein [Planctomycetota bacterium]
MDVLLINPPPPPAQRVSRGLMGGFGMIVGDGLCYPPLDLLYVAAVLERDGHRVRIVDAEALGLQPDAVLAQLGDPPPAVVGLATSSATIELDLKLVDRIKAVAPRTLTFITGSQGSKVPDLAMHGSRVDAVVRGEPEHTVAEMLRELGAGRDPLAVAGLTVRRGESIASNPDRPLLKGPELDALPFPARHLLPREPYRIPTMEGPVQTVASSRGCPINCTYCGYVVAQGIPWRGRSAASVLAELREIVEKHGVRNVVFRDPLFAGSRERTLELCALLEAARLPLRWQCETAIKTLDGELLAAMARAGCVSVSFGVESGNEELQRKYSRGKIKDWQHARTVVDACRRHGIATRGFFMIGFPEETPSQARQTMDLAVFLDPDTVQFTAVTPYPDTRLYKESRAGREEDFDYSRFSGTTPVGVAQAMTDEQVSRAIRQAYRRFYMRPARLLREFRRPQLLLQRFRRYVGLVQSSAQVAR